jgi:hypothetical protein
MSSIKTYAQYLEVLKNSPTEMFWIVPDEVKIAKDFTFNIYFTHDNEYDRKTNHVFLNGEHYDGIMLMSKHSPISEREFTHRFLIEKKEWNIVASNPKPYSIVFISYNEPNADENWEKLKARYPEALRVHGVKGIHNAHVEAAKLATTYMFWVVDGDAILMDDFNLDYVVPYYDVFGKSTVHVWRSRNPINNLEYGYGGIKLLPRELTLAVDVDSADMTTSISDKFKIMDKVSNITAFNTDPFSTWKSAFRECAKLSSGIIDRQESTETQERLDAWCVLNENVPYGYYGYLGALQGKQFGETCPTELYKINNFEWLHEQFSRNTLD